MSNETGAYAPQTGTTYLNELPLGAQIVAFGHRSGAETHAACPRRYFLNYEYLGRGITPSPGPLYFAVGTAVHHGLAAMLLGESIDTCVFRALNSFRGTGCYAALSDDEVIEQEVLIEGMLYAFYVYAYPGLHANFEVLCVETGAVEYVPIGTVCPVCNGNSFCADEKDGWCPRCSNTGLEPSYIAMQSRPDAILRNRQTHEVCGVSWKTIDDPSDLRRSQLVNDLQGYMEQYYGERILEHLAGAPVTTLEIALALCNITEWGNAPGSDPMKFIHDVQSSMAELEARALSARNIPTEVDYIQTIFLVKGPRKLLDDGDLTDALSRSLAGNYSLSENADEYGGYQPGKRYRQMSHLCYRYRNTEQISPVGELYKTGPNKGRPKPVDVNDPNLQEQSWAYRFYKPSNETMSGLSAKWLTSAIQPDYIRRWVDELNAGRVYPSTMRDERNANPIARVIRFEEPLYKDAARSASHVQQQRLRFAQIARNKQEFNDFVVEYAMAQQKWDQNAVMMKLDELFPQQLISCRTPYRCAYHAFCHGVESLQLDFQSIPERFEVRVPHHEAERQFFELPEGSLDGEK